MSGLDRLVAEVAVLRCVVERLQAEVAVLRLLLDAERQTVLALWPEASMGRA